MRNGVAHGRGIESLQTPEGGGYSYDGEFRDGKKHGFGMILFSNGDKYKG